MLHMGVEYSIFKILKKAGERRPAPAPPRLQLNDCGKLFEYVVHSSPQLGIVLLKPGDLVRVHAVSVGVNRHLIDVVGAPPLQRNQLPDGGQVNMENVAV